MQAVQDDVVVSCQVWVRLLSLSTRFLMIITVRIKDLCAPNAPVILEPKLSIRPKTLKLL